MARPLHLPSFFEEENFEILYKKHGQKKYGIRILALYYLQIDKSITEVSKLICKAAYTIRAWIKRYKKGGLKNLLSIRFGRGKGGKLSQENEKELIQEINVLNKSLSGGRLRALDIKSLIQKKFDVSYALSGVYALLHRLGYSKLFKSLLKNEFKEKLLSTLPPDVSLNQVEVWFQDETRIGQQGSLSRVWAKKGTRHRVNSNFYTNTFMELFSQKKEKERLLLEDVQILR